MIKNIARWSHAQKGGTLWRVSLSVSPYVILIALTLSSCCSSDSDEDVQPAPQEPVTDTRVPISFSGQQGEEQAVSAGVKRDTRGVTRAGTPLSELGVTRFKVWGYKNMDYTGSGYDGLQTVMPAYTVNWINNSAATTVTNSSGWEYVAQEADNDPEQTPKYWDWGAAAYRFFGVTGVAGDYEAYGANEANGIKFTMTADASPIRDGDASADAKIAANIADAPYFTKLWFSTGNAGDYPTRQFGQPVQLEFLKPFARVRFLFNFSYVSEGIKIRSKSFKPTDGTKIARKGTVTVTYPITGADIKESYSVTRNASPATGEELDAFTEEYIPEGSEKWYTVLPALSQDSYTMSVRLNNDAADKTAVVPAQYMTWLPGYSYTYIFKITEEGGIQIDLVQSAITPWVPISGDHQVFNW